MSFNKASASNNFNITNGDLFWSDRSARNQWRKFTPPYVLREEFRNKDNTVTSLRMGHRNAPLARTKIHTRWMLFLTSANSAIDIYYNFSTSGGWFNKWTDGSYCANFNGMLVRGSDEWKKPNWSTFAHQNERGASVGWGNGAWKTQSNSMAILDAYHIAYDSSSSHFYWFYRFVNDNNYCHATGDAWINYHPKEMVECGLYLTGQIGYITVRGEVL